MNAEYLVYFTLIKVLRIFNFLANSRKKAVGHGGGASAVKRRLQHSLLFGAPGLRPGLNP